MKISELEKALKLSWGRDTAEKFIPENPARGQCAITSLIVQDYFGGEIVFAPVLLPSGKLIAHYFNEVNSHEIDLTKNQFPDGYEVLHKAHNIRHCDSVRDFILSHPNAAIQYQILKNRVSQFIDNKPLP